VSSALYDDEGDFIATVSVSRAVDSDILLRALHGVMRNDTADVAPVKYGEIKNYKTKAKKKA
jgi:hypothetical protein